MRLKTREESKASIGCPAGERLVGGWDAIAFYTKRPPWPRTAAQVRVTHPKLTDQRMIMSATATDALPQDAHALVQLGAICAP